MVNFLFDALLGGREADDAPFLRFPGGGGLSYGGAFARSGQIANALTGLGVRPGDRVAAQTPKSAEALTLYLACVRAGAVYLPLNTAYTGAEVADLVGDAEPALLVGDPAAAKTLAPIAAAAGARLATLDADGRGTLASAADAAAASFDTVARGGDNLAAILYTSGTTGRSKGAMLSHANLVSNARTLAALWRFTAADVLLHALPIHHTHGLFTATNTLMAAGGSMLFLPRFDAGAVIEALPAATAMMGVPTFYTRLLAHPGFGAAAASHMRLFISGSAPLLAQTHREFETRTGHRILERYGMTETGMNASNPCDGERRAGTVGPPLPDVELRITDPGTGAATPAGETGMIEVRGPNVFQGYWRLPEKTREDLGEDGWFVTGDLGRIDAGGHVVIVGRSKDLIISGGLNVYPREVEAAIDALPGVAESAVVGAPHPDFGEAVVAVVVARPGAAADAAALLAALAGRLADFKRPKRVVFLDELPRNAMGKVQKNVLRQQVSGFF